MSALDDDAEGLADIACHVIGRHSRQETRDQRALDDDAEGLVNIARHDLGRHSSKQTRFRVRWMTPRA